MTRAIEKLAGRLRPASYARPRDRREIICHRCGVQCAVGMDAQLDDTLCIGCQRRLGAPRDERPRAARFVADWWDKAAAPGPGYGAVTCPHCRVACVVEVGGAVRTGCVACLRPLGAAPLVRTDLAPPAVVVVPDDGDDATDVTPWMVADCDSCMLFPGETR